MKLQFIYRYIIFSICTIVYTSCMTKRTYEKTAQVNASLYRDVNLQDTANIALLPWQDFFGDKQLRNLIDTGLKNNLDLKIGLERISKARSLVSQSKAAFLPDLSLNGQVARSRMAFPQSFGFVDNAITYELGLKTSWEIDVWGKLKNSKKAIFFRLMQEESTHRAIQTQLIAEIADLYYQLLALDEQVDILNHTIATRQEEVIAMKRLQESSIVTGAAVAQSEAALLDAQNMLPSVYRQIRMRENALNVLLGISPRSVERSSFTVQPSFPSVDIGVPLQLLQNRPDVMAAEFEIASYFENINVARKAFYPTLTIQAASGFTNFGFSNWFTPSGFFANVGGGLLQPVFSKRLNKTRLELAKSDYREKVLDFQKILLLAGQEVSDALYSYQSASEQETKRQNQLEKLQEALGYTQKLLLYHSSTNYTDVLASRQALLSAQMQMSNERLLKYQSLIYLYRSLGGGWRDRD